MKIGFISQIVVHPETGDLWGIDNAIRNGDDKPLLGVFRYKQDGTWVAFDTGLFGQDDYRLLTIAAVSDSIWVGMAFRQGMAYYDYRLGTWKPVQDDNDDDTCWVPGNIFSDVSTAPGGNLLVLSTPGGVYKLIDQR